VRQVFVGVGGSKPENFFTSLSVRISEVVPFLAQEKFHFCGLWMLLDILRHYIRYRARCEPESDHSYCGGMREMTENVPAARRLTRYPKEMVRAAMQRATEVMANRIDAVVPLGWCAVTTIPTPTPSTDQNPEGKELAVQFDLSRDLSGVFTDTSLHDRIFRLTTKGLRDILNPEGTVSVGVSHHDNQVKTGRLDLLAEYLTQLFRHSSLRDRLRLFRGVDNVPRGDFDATGAVRSINSTAYLRIDTADILEIVMGKVEEKGLDILNFRYTDFGEHMSMYVVDPNLSFSLEGRQDDGAGGVHHGLCRISASETGQGSIRVEPGVLTGACVNGQVFTSFFKRKYHVTGHADEMGIWAEDTQQQRVRTVLMEVRDMIASSFSDETFTGFANRIREAAGEEISEKQAKRILKVELGKHDATKGKETMEAMLNRFMGQFSAKPQQTRYDLAQVVNGDREYDADTDLATVLEDISGTILMQGSRTE